MGRADSPRASRAAARAATSAASPSSRGTDDCGGSGATIRSEEGSPTETLDFASLEARLEALGLASSSGWAHAGLQPLLDGPAAVQRLGSALGSKDLDGSAGLPPQPHRALSEELARKLVSHAKEEATLALVAAQRLQLDEIQAAATMRRDALGVDIAELRVRLAAEPAGTAAPLASRGFRDLCTVSGAAAYKARRLRADSQGEDLVSAVIELETAWQALGQAEPAVEDKRTLAEVRFTQDAVETSIEHVRGILKLGRDRARGEDASPGDADAEVFAPSDERSAAPSPAPSGGALQSPPAELPLVPIWDSGAHDPLWSPMLGCGGDSGGLPAMPPVWDSGAADPLWGSMLTADGTGGAAWDADEPLWDAMLTADGTGGAAWDAPAADGLRFGVTLFDDMFADVGSDE